MLELLTSLINKSLVVAETLEAPVARYRLLETIKQYASERLELSGTWTQTHDFYLSCYVEFAEARADKLWEAEQQRYIPELETEHDNLRVALAWAYERRRTPEGLRLAIALYQLWDARDYIREGFTWFERLLHLPPEAAAQLPLALHVNALTFGSFLAMFLNNVTVTTAWSNEAIALCEAAGEAGKPLLGFALAGAVRIAGDYETELKLLERTRDLEREMGNPKSRNVGMSLFISGSIETALGHYEAAHHYLDEALVIAEGAEDFYRTAHVLNVLGDLARCEGQFAQAVSFSEKSLALFQKAGANRGVPNTERSLAYACLRQGETSRAYHLFKGSLEEHYRRSFRAGIMRELLGFASLAAATGLAEASALLYGFAHRRDRVVGLESGEKADELDDEHFAARARDQLTSEELETARNKGRNLTLEQAVTFALNLPLTSQIAKEPSHDLTRRELEVLTLIAKGLANSEIASHLDLSKRTVEKHVANILSKLDLKNRAQLVRWAIDQKVISTAT